MQYINTAHHTTTDLPSRIRSKINVGESGCWQWAGAVQSRGYGSVFFEGRIKLTHRVVYQLLVGPIPNDLQIDHLCRNKLCCNPDHLEVVTGRTNCSRTEAANKTHCIHGHPLSGKNLIIKRRPSGRTIRNCRICARATSRRSCLRNIRTEVVS